MLHNQKLGFKDFAFTSFMASRLNYPSVDSISSGTFEYQAYYYNQIIFRTDVDENIYEL